MIAAKRNTARRWPPTPTPLLHANPTKAAEGDGGRGAGRDARLRDGRRLVLGRLLRAGGRGRRGRGGRDGSVRLHRLCLTRARASSRAGTLPEPSEVFAGEGRCQRFEKRNGHTVEK